MAAPKAIAEIINISLSYHSFESSFTAFFETFFEASVCFMTEEGPFVFPAEDPIVEKVMFLSPFTPIPLQAKKGTVKMSKQNKIKRFIIGDPQFKYPFSIPQHQARAQ